MREGMDEASIKPDERGYPLCVMFRGYQEPEVFGWQE
jgi:hypothetical protein